jgi:crotonobetainyl-CoA:carnitine CoA-transferase CaiB-like acyl-CoA transferase
MADMLSGIRVVAAESWGVVPGATGLLADMGAIVIRVEPPGVGDGMRGMQAAAPQGGRPGGSTFDVWNRGKQSITLDVSKPGGKEILLKLLETADVFTHNLRPSALERYGLQYEALAARYPRLVYAGFTAYGEQGIDRDRPGVGPVALWTRAGLAAHFGDVDVMPEPTRGAMDDSIATLGLLNCILGALLERERSGLGQKVTTSHYHVGTWINTLVHARLAGEDVPPRISHWDNPARAFYRCQDDRWLLVAGVNEGHWRGLLRGVGREDLIGDPRFGSPEARRANRETLVPLLQQEFAKRPARDWVRRVAEAGGVCDVAQDVDDIVDDPQAEQNGFFVAQDSPLGTYRVLAPPLQYSRTPLTPRGLAPALGEHTNAVLEQLGYSPGEIDAYRAEGVI